MPIPQEICVFFPCHTLEDFPTHLRDESADGILAAWTAPWHPAIIAATGAIPTWHRADTPPVDLKQRLLLIPSASESRIPSDLQGRIADAVDCHRLSVTSRQQATNEILSYCKDNSDAASVPDHLFTTTDKIVAGTSAADFYALGYLALQVQVMTRRLRYSSNLDQVTFSEHIVAAAKAFVAEHDSVQPSLQAAFDLLAEERDHYFSSDPHLIDLVLVAPSTLGQPLEETLNSDHPINLLMSAETAELIAQNHPTLAARIRERHQAETLSIVGGYPDDHTRLDFLGSSSIGSWLNTAIARTESALGVRPTVFGRLGGGFPGDLTPWLVAAGFRGAVTNDFYSGVGWQDEPKMLLQSGGAELEALTAKPLDILQPQSFLGLGPKLGEIADAGQVSAALLVRWPGTDSPYMEDLRRASSRTLALGKLWTLEKFFTHGERPYHSCSLPSVPADGAGLDAMVQSAAADPLSGTAKTFLQAIQQETASVCSSLASLLRASSSIANDKPTAETPSGSKPTIANHSPTAVGNDIGTTSQFIQATTELIAALGFKQSENTSITTAAAVINPHCGAARSQVLLAGKPPAANSPGLFGSSLSKAGTSITLDIPGNGFATIKSSSSGSAKSSSKKGLLGLFAKPKLLAQGQSLSNEFLDIAIHPETGAVAAVHAGQQRGNRFSWQLAYYDAAGPNDGYSRMRANSIKVISSDSALGVIRSVGELVVGEQVVGRFAIDYSIHRGSRWLEIDATITELNSQLSQQPWKNYVAGRATWATEALSIRPLVRDKRHRTSGKRIEAPLGVLIDEGDRKLQVCSYGLPAHRRIGSKELDTLLVVSGESARCFRLAYGFDVPDAVRTARQHLVPPIAIPLRQLDTDPARGWLIDVDSRSVVITGARAVDANTVEINVVETSGKPTQAKVSLFRDVASATRLRNDVANSDTQNGNSAAREEVPIEDGAAVLRLGGHEVAAVALKLK